MAWGSWSELSTGEIVQVFPAARNIGQEDQSRHIFLYIPPLTLKRDSAGQVETLVTTTGGVRVEMRGASPRITNGLHQWLAVDGSLPAARRPGSRSVRPLPYHEIRIFDTDVVDEARWEAVYPTVADLIPVSQEWIPFVFRRRPGVSESAADFIERLRDPVRLPSLQASVSYGGRFQVVDSVIINSSSLRTTDFLVALKGDGGRELVTRDQARELVSSYITNITQRVYRESSDPDPISVDEGWLGEDLFREVRMSGNDFWFNQDNLRRAGYSADDYSPDRHREILQTTTAEMQDESKDMLSREMSDEWTKGPASTTVSGGASFPLGFGGNASVSTSGGATSGAEAESIDKEQFDSYLKSEGSSHEWRGEVIEPKNVVLYQLDDEAFNTETQLAQINVQTTRATAVFGYTVFNTVFNHEPETDVAVSPPRPPGTVDRDCDECPEMVVMPGGKLAMGRYEVTVAEYAAFATATGRGAGGGCSTVRRWRDSEGADASWRNPGFRQSARHPVVCVSWDDAQAYVSWLSDRTRETYRLPSEREWRRAADGSEVHSCDVNGRDLSLKRWVEGRAGSVSESSLACPGSDRSPTTAPVGSYHENRVGLFDMVGNVWEWTEDCWDETRCIRIANRVVRGGSWFDSRVNLGVDARVSQRPNGRTYYTGFRVAKELD